MLNKIIDFLDLDTDVELVINVKDFEKERYVDFFTCIDFYKSTVEYIHAYDKPNSVIVVMKLKHREYMKFMKRLHQKDLNLKQRTFGLTDDLVEWKDPTAK